MEPWKSRLGVLSPLVLLVTLLVAAKAMVSFDAPNVCVIHPDKSQTCMQCEDPAKGLVACWPQKLILIQK